MAYNPVQSSGDGLDEIVGEQEVDQTAPSRSNIYAFPKKMDLVANVAQHQEFVMRLARRVASSMPHSVDVGDLVQDGYLGLMDAMKRYNPARGIKFETFAERRVKGAMIDSLRKDAWSRSIRKRKREVVQINEDYFLKKGEYPDDNTVAEKLGVSAKKYRKFILRLMDLYAMSGFTTPENPDGHVSNETLAVTFGGRTEQNPLERILKGEDRETVFAAVRSLPPRERKVVKLYYVDELTMDQIGEIIGVNTSRISQLHARAIERMKRYLGSTYAN